MHGILGSTLAKAGVCCLAGISLSAPGCADNAKQVGNMLDFQTRGLPRRVAMMEKGSDKQTCACREKTPSWASHGLCAKVFFFSHQLHTLQAGCRDLLWFRGCASNERWYALNQPPGPKEQHLIQAYIVLVANLMTSLFLASTDKVQAQRQPPAICGCRVLERYCELWL